MAKLILETNLQKIVNPYNKRMRSFIVEVGEFGRVYECTSPVKTSTFPDVGCLSYDDVMNYFRTTEVDGLTCDDFYERLHIDNQALFFNVTRIVMDLYLGRDVKLLVLPDEPTSELFISYLYNRYGIIGYYDDGINDVPEISFDPDKLHMLDSDLERFRYIQYKGGIEDYYEICNKFKVNWN